MELNKVNLSTKNIKDFVKGDTIYIRRMKEFNQPLYLCTFLKYEKGVVYGTVIWKDNAEYSQQSDIDKGLRIAAQLTNCALYGSSVEDEKHSHFFWFNYQGYAYHPEEVHKVSESGDTYVANHPAYGQISLSRASYNTPQSLFGSSVKSGNVIRLEISKATLNRKLNNDYVHSDDRLIEVELSNVQFAELITTLNYGEGIPCTIKAVGNEFIGTPPYNSKVEQFKAEFKNKLHNIGVDVNRIMKDSAEMLKNKDYLNKGDRLEILNSIEMLVQDISKNVPFIADQFTKQMDKTIGAAKGEVEAYYSNVIHKIGSEVIKQGLVIPEIDNGKKIENE